MSNIVRHDAPVYSLSTLIDELFNDPIFSFSDREITGAWWPRVDIAENDNDYTLKADLPGMTKDNIKVEINNGVLTISGEKKEERSETRKGRYYHFERTFGSFTRSFALPDGINSENISASFANGVLTLSIPKSEKAKPKLIEVKAD